MKIHQSHSLVRIIRERDECWMGVGFVIPDDSGRPSHIMTCAHVVADACGDRNLAYVDEPPGNDLLVDFPNMGNDRFRARALSDDGAWHPMQQVIDANRIAQDIAVLELSPGSTFPQDCVPALFSRRDVPSGATVRGFGSPQGVAAEEDFGHYSDGRYAGMNRRLLTFHASDSKDNRFIREGCSGGPLWCDELDNCAVGMVTCAYEDKSIAFATPFGELLKAWPPLGRCADGMGWVSAPSFDPAFFFIDRSIQSIEFDALVEAAYGQSPHQGGICKPLVCILQGEYRQGHDEMRQRFKFHPIRQRHRLSSDTPAVAMDWPYGAGAGRGMRMLRYRLHQGLKAIGTENQDFIDAINRRTGALYAYVTVRAAEFGHADCELMTEFIRMWKDIGDRSPGLTSEFYVFISFQFCRDADANTPMAAFIGGDLQACLGAADDDHAVLEHMLSVRPEEIETWCDTITYHGFRLSRDPFELKRDVKELFGPDESLAMIDLLKRIRDSNVTL